MVMGAGTQRKGNPTWPEVPLHSEARMPKAAR